MRRKSKSSSFLVDQLEIRQLLSAVIYVSEFAPSTPQNGTSWATAYQSLKAGLSAAASVATASNPVVIKVGQGSYYTGGTFQLLDNVAIDGGYAGYGQTNPDVRAPATYASVLSGQIAVGGAPTSLHVVTGSGTNSTAILDGFTITDGKANGGGSNYSDYGAGIFDNAGSPTINDCIITGNTALQSGGGMANINYSSPTLTNCTISGNTATGGGGGAILNNNHSSPTLINCILSGNTAKDGGGGMYDGLYSSPVLTNCTLSGNTANSGGGISNSEYSSPVLTNCTLSGNTASTGGGMSNGFNDYPALTNCILWGDTAKTGGNESTGGTVTITYSDIEQSGFTGAGDIDTNPLFIRNSGTLGSADFGDLRLQSASPVIGHGNVNAPKLSGITTDLDGLSRIAGGHVDMGAYESHWAFQGTLYVDASATGAATGSDWADAYPNLAAALDYAVSGETIDVAQGIYKPTLDTNRCDTFQLVNGVNIQGGFAGQVNPTAAQNVSAYPTILSGILGADVIENPATRGFFSNAGDSFHVVIGSGTNATAVLDGFTITGGNANIYQSTQFDDVGGGIFDNAGSPTISYCTLTGNTAYNGGGMANFNSSSPTLTNSTLSGNNALLQSNNGYGGGMFNDGSSPTLTNCILNANTAGNWGGGIANMAESNPTLTNCTLNGNTAMQSQSGSGGGMYDVNSSPTLTDCMVTGNSAPDSGGGIISNGGVLTMANCTITGNTDGTAGGGIDNRGSATLTNCTITGNTTGSEGGGGISNGGSLTLVNCTLSGNTAGMGGAIYNNSNNGATATLTNCTLSGNTAVTGGAVYNNSKNGATATLTNCILWGDTASRSGNETSGGAITITYSDIAGGYAGTGNINANPMFIRSVGTNGTTDYGDLHLQFTSPAIDAGSNAAVPAGVTTDLDGNPRFFDFPGANNGAGAVVDMGAYELGYNLDEVIVPASQTVALPAGGYPFSAKALIIGTGGTLDVADDYLTINYANVDPASSIAALISTGYANGNWNGTGIISSNTLGEPANSTGVGDYDNGTQIKIARTWDGDANVDGIINSDDLSLVMLGQAQNGTRWQDGNFNYGTQVNADDWMKLFYALALSKGQMRPAAVVINPSTQIAKLATVGVTPAEINSSTLPIIQTSVSLDGTLGDLLNSPQGALSLL
ncbi:MAG TPA: right-handed parallel beta-helix repeat-containing protein [Tepidisphaeraceae bacterium]|jgi:parallel beta-helix repeat protein